MSPSGSARAASRSRRRPFHRGAVALAVVAGASGVGLVWLAVRAGAGAEAVFPLLLMWLVVVAGAAKLGMRVVAAWRRRRARDRGDDADRGDEEV